jgi:hypothetical protein
MGEKLSQCQCVVTDGVCRAANNLSNNGKATRAIRGSKRVFVRKFRVLVKQ